MDEPTPAPLLSWSFDGVLRTYQAEVLERIPAGTDGPWHIVAPPGSGKTLLGLLLAAREGRRTLVLTPSLTIREQWLRTARGLVPEPDRASDDPAADADLTVLTYQLLSVTGDGSPFEQLARTVWIEELVAAGRTETDAATWLAELAIDNPSAHRAGLRRRVRSLRSRFARRHPDELARVLHPNAVALIDGLVASGVRTIVLDECHHLLDHWALVVAYLAARIRASGGRPLLIGLTATLPSPDDGNEFENYTQLLGDVDHEVPTPAVVKEGHLAPYRDHVRFTEPTPAEMSFLHGQERLLDDLLVQVLSTPDGVSYLEQRLQPPAGPDDPQARLDLALAEDFTAARTSAVVLRELVPEHPLVALLPAVLLDRCTSDDLLTTITRFALDRLLPDPGARRQWEYVKRALADFGLQLTDRGLRRGRDPIDTVLAHSEAKDRAAVEILHEELAGDEGDRVRAVVVTDFVEHGNSRGQAGAFAAGALRTFDLLVADPVTARLDPVLLTSRHLRVAAASADRTAAALSRLLGSPVEVLPSTGASRDLRTPERGGTLVTAVSELIRRGDVRLLVGTRGLLGEGWDCPAVNTLIDLTSVTTSSATQQLRGRTLRLDAAWPDKVAHNWSVVCLIPPHLAIDDTTETSRLRRKHAHLWGLDASGDGRIVSGLDHLLTDDAASALRAVQEKHVAATIDGIEAVLHASRATRSQTREQWRVGAPYSATERESVVVHRTRTAPLLLSASNARTRAVPVFAGGTAIGGAVLSGVAALSSAQITPPMGVGIALAVGAAAATASALPALISALRDRRRPAEVYRRATIAISRALHDAGRLGPVDEAAIRALPDDDARVRIEMSGTPTERRLIADAVEELFSPVRTPRFLLRVDRGGARRTPLVDRIADRLSPGRTLLPVPRAIARRRADAEGFAGHWEQAVGPCDLIELRGPEGLALLRVARSAEGRLDPTDARARTWG